MILSDRTIEFLSITICGDNDILPYKTGKELVRFFNSIGYDDVYDYSKFGVRKVYVQNKLESVNDFKSLKPILENIIDLIEIEESEIESSLKKINKYLKIENLLLQLKSESKLLLVNLNNESIETTFNDKIDNEFIKEQISKCKEKINQKDYSGCITNSRSLLELVLIDIIESFKDKKYNNNGDLEKMFKEVKSFLFPMIESSVLPNETKQIMTGLKSLINGLAGLSNQFGDRHGNKHKALEHHAKLSVNSSLTLCEYLIDLRDIRKGKV